jgi:DNA primase catalytic core
LARSRQNRRDVLDQVLAIDIVGVARDLGLQIENSRGAERRAICPFHKDTRPSLNFFRAAARVGSDRDHFHCFACGAHGDVIDLVQGVQRAAFKDALEWLARRAGIAIEASYVEEIDRRSGLEEFGSLLETARVRPSASFRKFAESRRFDPEWLQKVGTAIVKLNPLLEKARRSPAIAKALKVAGIAREVEQVDQSDLWKSDIRGFFAGERFVIEIRDAGGQFAGFAARATGDQVPKYLFTAGFPKKETLYRFDEVLKRLARERQQNIKDEFELFLTEGVFDALRLESLGIAAVAILGSAMTEQQSDLLSRVQKQCAADGRELSIHIFLDHDEAGRRGARDAIFSCLRLLHDGAPFLLDVIWPDIALTQKADPDSLFSGNESRDAKISLAAMAVSPLAFLVAFEFNEDPRRIPWTDRGRLAKLRAARSIALSTPQNVSWDRILPAIRTQGDTDDTDLVEVIRLILDYARAPVDHTPSTAPIKPLAEKVDDRAALLSSLAIARSSTSRREFPLDDDAWERLSTAATALFHIHKARLGSADGQSSPLFAREVPKGEGRYRVKSGPVAEDLLLQQYAMLELLRPRASTPTFHQLIPAVRYWRDRERGSQIETTGEAEGIDQHIETVSFAYQIDMSIVSEEVPPQHEGMFRRYFDCWRSFIDALNQRLSRMPFDEIQILRLDISGFYDNIRKEAVENALKSPLQRALKRIPEALLGPRSFAPMFAPNVLDASMRASSFVDFLTSHAFNLRVHDPKTGSIEPTRHNLGIPQGPDLSAYLANVSLFELDRVMREEVRLLDVEVANEWSGGAIPVPAAAAYARYVDDIIVICRDMSTALRLRRRIEEQLRLCGLQLNRKNTVPPPMTRKQARAWLTDNRSGFGFSGPLQDLPSTDAMDPLADAGEMDRKSALGYLADPLLEDPARKSKAIDAIRTAMRAPDLRFNDRARAYRAIWIQSVDCSLYQSGRAMAEEFVRLVHLASDAPLPLAHGFDRDAAIACVDALERCLRLELSKNSFDTEALARVESHLDRLAIAALDNLPEHFAALAMSSETASLFLSRFDIRTQIATIWRLSAQRIRRRSLDANISSTIGAIRRVVEPENTPTAIRLPSTITAPLARFEPSLVAFSQPPLSPNSDVIFCWLHHVIVQLQRTADTASGITDLPEQLPFAPVVSASGIDGIARDILGIWLQHTDGTSDADRAIERDAASSLINLAHHRFATLVQQRPRLLRLIANTTDVHALPSPPGIQVPGILLWCEDKKLLLATAQDVSEDEFPSGVSWTTRENGSSSTIAGVKLSEGALPDGAVLLLKQEINWSPSRIAATYRALHRRWLPLKQGLDSHVPLPTVFSFFGPSGTPGADADSFRVVCWTAPKSSADGHAFVRVGQSLEARSVFENGSDYWRFGWAIRDLVGRADESKDEHDGLDSHADVSLSTDEQRKSAMIARAMPRLSGANRWGPGSIAEGASIPTRIERGLKFLEQFDRCDSVAACAGLLVCVIAEGVFMNERSQGAHRLERGGAPAALLCRSVGRASRSFPEAAQYWPQPSLDRLPGRRPSAAWFALSGRLAAVKDGIGSEFATVTETLVLGCRILGVVSALRSTAFESAATLDEFSRNQITEMEPDEEWLQEQLGADVLLIEESEGSPGSDTKEQVQLLLSAFVDILQARRQSLNELRDSITPVGWAVLVGLLLQLIPTREGASPGRPLLVPVSTKDRTLAEDSFKQLISFLGKNAEVASDDNLWPWDAFVPLHANIGLIAVLAAIDRLLPYRVSTSVTYINPRSERTSGNRPTVYLEDRTAYVIADWQIDLAYIRGERGGLESYDQDSRIKYIYSAARSDQLLLALHLVSRKLAIASFGNALDERRWEQVAVSHPEVDRSEQSPEESTERQSSAADGSEEFVGDSLRSTLPLPKTNVTHDRDDQYLEAGIRAVQRKSWRARKNQKRPGLHRVAILQWDVVDSYYDPGLHLGQTERLAVTNGGRLQPPDEKQIKAGGSFLSLSEHRRRTILLAALETCVEFGVDGLVLPEYSVRPETVNWLARRLAQKSAPQTLWAGTFRVSSGTALDLVNAPIVQFSKAVGDNAPNGATRFHAHEAILTCLNAASNEGAAAAVKWYWRQKRYPSAAAKELIRPPLTSPWQPLLTNQHDPFRLGTFSLELICSEIFPHASSANFIGVIEECDRLAKRYNLPPTSETIKQWISKDVFEFAKWTSYRNGLPKHLDSEQDFARGEALQRTLMIIPAMTNRSADYHIFGQNQHLAAGLVTAFCNAVSDSYACGGSCFIGLDGWTSSETIESPYGDIAPGVYQVQKLDQAGPLGRHECAMVIADLDLLRTVDQRPRPHYQSQPLSLVAHLPLIFSTEAGAKGPSSELNVRRSRLREIGMPNSAQHSVLSFWQAMVGQKQAFEPDAPDSAVSAVLELLARFADDGNWLKRRQEAYRQRRQLAPVGTPAAALVDWIFVDDDFRLADAATFSGKDNPYDADGPYLEVAPT